MSALATTPVQVTCLAVRKMPKSGKPDELLEYEEISWKAIVKTVLNLVQKKETQNQ